MYAHTNTKDYMSTYELIVQECFLFLIYFIDPCESPTACGVNADCRTVNHRVVCSCPAGYTGDPGYRCTKGLFLC